MIRAGPWISAAVRDAGPRELYEEQHGAPGGGMRRAEAILCVQAIRNRDAAPHHQPRSAGPRPCWITFHTALSNRRYRSRPDERVWLWWLERKPRGVAPWLTHHRWSLRVSASAHRSATTPCASALARVESAVAEQDTLSGLPHRTAAVVDKIDLRDGLLLKGSEVDGPAVATGARFSGAGAEQLVGFNRGSSVCSSVSGVSQAMMANRECARCRSGRWSGPEAAVAGLAAPLPAAAAAEDPPEHGSRARVHSPRYSRGERDLVWWACRRSDGAACRHVGAGGWSLQRSPGGGRGQLDLSRGGSRSTPRVGGRDDPLLPGEAGVALVIERASDARRTSLGELGVAQQPGLAAAPPWLSETARPPTRCSLWRSGCGSPGVSSLWPQRQGSPRWESTPCITSDSACYPAHSQDVVDA